MKKEYAILASAHLFGGEMVSVILTVKTHEYAEKVIEETLKSKPDYKLYILEQYTKIQ